MKGGVTLASRGNGVKRGKVLQDAMLQARQELLDKLRQVHEERTKLTQVAMAIMLPRRSLADMNKKEEPTEEKLKRFSAYGAGGMLSQTAELVTAMSRLKANILLERRSLVQLHARLLHKVCTGLAAQLVLCICSAKCVAALAWMYVFVIRVFSSFIALFSYLDLLWATAIDGRVVTRC
jgi:hypothetical protein